jgi:hypothetical protein
MSVQLVRDQADRASYLFIFIIPDTSDHKQASSAQEFDGKLVA